SGTNEDVRPYRVQMKTLKFLSLCFVFLALPARRAFSYGEAGHRVVGAIADERLANTPAGEALKKLLGTITLERAATLPDELRGDEPETNARKITRPVALVLLAHYVGDIHQPLHVGAAYFDSNGKLIDPNTDDSAMEDKGGNAISFGGTTLHGYWDSDTVDSS